jgi:hypothetical protein
MNHKITEADFDFEYTGSNSTEEDMIKNGHRQLSGKELRSRISNKTIYGDYPNGYKFVTDINENGIAEGINNVGSYDFGSWLIDADVNTLSLKWNNGWVDTVTHAYDVNGNIEFYDVDSGNWRTTFKKFKNWKEE